jgi:DNA-binding NarL/FixJ family response regulator
LHSGLFGHSKPSDVSLIWQHYQGDMRYDFLSAMPHILIVDDHEFVRTALCNSISIAEPAWQLSEAASGKEALEVFRKVEPEVVVLDIVMNDMNGFEAAHQIRQINPDAKIVFMSSRYRIHDASGMPQLLGDGAFVQKAEASCVLLPTIKRLLGIRTQTSIQAVESNPASTIAVIAPNTDTAAFLDVLPSAAQK